MKKKILTFVISIISIYWFVDTSGPVNRLLDVMGIKESSKMLYLAATATLVAGVASLGLSRIGRLISKRWNVFFKESEIKNEILRDGGKIEELKFRVNGQNEYKIMDVELHVSVKHYGKAFLSVNKRCGAKILFCFNPECSIDISEYSEKSVFFKIDDSNNIEIDCFSQFRVSGYKKASEISTRLKIVPKRVSEASVDGHFEIIQGSNNVEWYIKALQKMLNSRFKMRESDFQIICEGVREDD
ncbi:hypothetical protein LABALGNA3A7_16440 [Dellaglioa algida]|nr:hypothetical protein LABALGNA3A7_16440 [Dellaglioa algida]